jgi:hypothetical protein
MEFLVLHSTAFLVGFRLMKGFPTWVFFLIYAPFGLILGASMSSYLATVLFFWHLASGVWGDFDMAERNIGGFLMRYLPSFLWFFMLPFAVVLLKLPALGWDEYPGLAFRTDQGFRSAAQRSAYPRMGDAVLHGASVLGNGDAALGADRGSRPLPQGGAADVSRPHLDPQP